MNLSSRLRDSNLQATVLLGMMTARGNRITLRAGAELYQSSHVAVYNKNPGNYLVYARTIEKCWGDVDLGTMSGLAVSQLTAYLDGLGLKRSTVNRHLQYLKAMCNKLREWGYQVPLVKIKIRKESHKVLFFSLDEVHQLMDSRLFKMPRYQHLKDFIVIDLQTGLRKQELLGLTWDQVDLQAGVITLPDTKSGELQNVMISENLKKYLEGLKARLYGKYVISGWNGARIKDIKKSFRHLLMVEGLYREGLCVHTLRHTFASQLSMNGTDIPTIKELLRHQNVATTMRYAHLSQEHKKFELNKTAQMIEH